MLVAGVVVAGVGCSPTMTVKHEVAPIHITVDVNVKVQEELDEFFDFEDRVMETDSTTLDQEGEG
jgi:hypothetical protein